MKVVSEGWKDYNSSSWLSRGDEVRLNQFAGKGLGDKVGFVEKSLRKNIRVMIDGKSWTISPNLIHEYKTGDSSNVPVAKKSEIQCCAVAAMDCQVGDVILMYRGKFDIVKVTAIDHRGIHGKVLGGRSEKGYVYKNEWFVQKLDKDNFI